MILYPSRPTRFHSLEAAYALNPDLWRWQLKFNGHHAVVSTHMPNVVYSRGGVPLVSAKDTDFSTECAKVFGLDCVLDGELVGPAQGGPASGYWLVVWDIPVRHGVDLTRRPYSERLAILDGYKTSFNAAGRSRVRHNIWIAETYPFQDLHTARVARLAEPLLVEGIVAKRLSSGLHWSRTKQIETHDVFKYRF